MRTPCPACYSSIDARSSRCCACHAVLERVPGGVAGVVTGSICAVVSGVKGFVVGLIVGAVVQAAFGLQHLALVVAIGWTMVIAASAYWWGSTRLREQQPGGAQDPDITVYFADKLQVLDLRRR